MLNKEQLKQVLVEQYNSFLSKDTGIKRIALREVSAKKEFPHINVITGIRRCGKSVFLRQITKEFYNDNGFFLFRSLIV
jgi:predicted AAA+ superfamily ATPase